MTPMIAAVLGYTLALLPAAHGATCFSEGAVIPVPEKTLERSLDAPLPAHTVFAWKEKEEWRFALLPSVAVADAASTRARITPFALSGLHALRAEMKQLTIGTSLTLKVLDPEGSLSSLRSEISEAAQDAGVELKTPL